ncbi:MAG TPA: rhomboid family intramembrane serine protease [Puia sp.]|nr:rhomboid family intramembrane serine protease [Puia sp.]
MTDFRLGRSQVIPPVIKNLIIINVVVFLVQWTFENRGSAWMENFFALHDIRSSFFKPHQIITYMFLHGGFMHIFWNMLILWMFGSILENYWGPKRFLTFYIVCGIGAALLHLLVIYQELSPVFDSLNSLPIHEQMAIRADSHMNINQPTLGASGAIFGCMVAFGLLFPNSLIYIYALIPIKAKWAVLAYVVYELFLGVQNNAGDNVAHWAHLGGGLVGLLLVFYWRKTDRKNFY